MQKKQKNFVFVHKVTGEECHIVAGHGADAAFELLNSVPEKDRENWLIP